jgi:hypothetical protein
MSLENAFLLLGAGIAISIVLSYFSLGTLSMFRVTPLLFGLYFPMILQAGLGVAIMALDIGSARDNMNLVFVSADEPYLDAMVSVALALALVPAGMLILCAALGFNPRTALSQYLTAPMKDFQEGRSTAWVVFAIVSGFLTLLAIFVLIDSPLVASFKTAMSQSELAVLRVQWSMDISASRRIVLNLFGTQLGAAISYITLAQALMTKAPRWIGLFIAQLPAVLVLQCADLSKSSAAYFAVGFIFVLVFVRGRLGATTLLGAIGACVLLLFVSYQLAGFSFMAESHTIFADDNIIGRTFVGQLVGLPNYFTIFPTVHPFLYGSEAQFLRLLGFEPKTAARIAMEYLFLDAANLGVQNTFFVGAAYANFGWPGVIFGPLWVGIVLQFSQIGLLKLPKNAFFVGAGTWVSFFLVRSLGGGFIGEFIFNTTILGTLFLLSGLYVVLGLLKTK